MDMNHPSGPQGSPQLGLGIISKPFRYVDMHIPLWPQPSYAKVGAIEGHQR